MNDLETRNLIHNELNRIANLYRTKKAELTQQQDKAEFPSEMQELINERERALIGLRQFIEMTDAAGYCIEYTVEDLK
jgi:hypothetical protein